MKDFPMFTTENGAASLKMREIPYSGCAYITIHDTVEPGALLDDCLGFCRAVGAECVYATGHDFLQNYPFHTHIYKMQALKEHIGETDASIFPVTDRTLQKFRHFYNEKMASVPNASYMDQKDAGRILEEGNSYFVHRDGTFLGIAIGSGSEIQAIASNVPGAGKTLVQAICHALSDDTVTLEVASSNIRAIRLYKELGFFTSQVISSWYKIF